MYSQQVERRTTGQAAIAFFISLLMAFGMLGFVAPAANADMVHDLTQTTTMTIDGQTYEFRLTSKAGDATVAVGDQINLSQFVDLEKTGCLQDYPTHMDYIIVGGTGEGSVVKHTGVLTARETGAAAGKDGTIQVKAALVTGETPQPQQPGTNTPGELDGDEILSFTITVTVTPQTAYGYQGSPNSIMLENYPIEWWQGDMANGYTNMIQGKVNKVEGTNYVDFTIKMSAGFRSYNTPELFTDLNKGNVELRNALGVTTASLGDATGNLTVVAVNHDTREITLRANVGTFMFGNSGSIVFNPGFRGNNANQIIGTTVEFGFNL